MDSNEKKVPTLLIVIVFIIICLVAFIIINFRPKYIDNSNEENTAETIVVVEEEEVNPNPYVDIEVGDTVMLGTYMQNSTNKENIAWVVIRKDSGKMLLLSRYVLDCKVYNSNSNKSNRWVDSSLRSWLNNEFLNQNFTEEESEYITENTIRDIDGSNISDKVFILSKEEINNYVPADLKIAEGTPKAFEACGAKKENGLKYLCYWVRSSGSTNDSVIDFDITGAYYDKGYPTYYSDGIRIAMWIDYEK